MRRLPTLAYLVITVCLLVTLNYAQSGSQLRMDGTTSGGVTDATFITQTTNATLTAEQALSALSSGIMRVATTTGVVTALTDSAGIATNVSDETGTGVMAFATSPTFTTGITVGAGGVPGTLTIGNDVRISSEDGTANFEMRSGAGAQTGRLLIAFIANDPDGKLWISSTAPTISSGFGTSPSISSANGAFAFRVNVGTGGSASTGVVAMPAATTGWNCNVNDVTTPASFITDQTASTTTTVSVTNYSRTTGLAIAWTASDILAFFCGAF